MRGKPQSKGNILVVEKDPFYSSLYEKTLSGEGYGVFLAEGVEEGLRLFGERAYDVVISDMVLKGEDGLVLLESIKKASPGQDVIMITSMQSIRKAVDALKLGASDYLTKPVDEEELLMLIRRLIDRQNISDEHSRLVSENVLFFEQFRVQKRSLELLRMLDADRIIDHLLDMIIEETGSMGASLYLYSEMDENFSFAAGRGTSRSAVTCHAPSSWRSCLDTATRRDLPAAGMRLRRRPRACTSRCAVSRRRFRSTLRRTRPARRRP